MSRIRTRRTLAAVLTAGAAVLGLVQAQTALATTHKPTLPTVKVCGQGHAATRPGEMILTCADNGEKAERLTWTSWTATRATATGLVAWRACTSNCAHAKTWKTATAQFALSNPVATPGAGTLFTKLTLHTTGATPKGFMRDLSFDEAPAPTVAGLSKQPVPLGVHAATAGSATALSGTLGYAQIEGYWIAAGGPASTAETAAAITGAESSYEPGIIQQTVSYCGTGSDRAGWGLWQITCGNSVPAYGSNFQLLDPWNNAEAAVTKYNGANGFTPWSTYTAGTYQNFLQSVTPATGLTDPGEYTQAGSTPNGTPSSPAAAPGSTYGPAIPSATPLTHDATGDGKSDLMIYEPDGTIQMGVGTGDGFTNYHEISGGWGGFDGRLHFADVTGDGKADLLIYEPDGTIQMGVGTGNGFTNYHQISSGWGGYDGRIQFADINGDGKADMLIFQPDGTLTVGISNGNGFTNYHEISSGWSTYYPRIQFADVTGDGKADILIYEPDGTIQMGVGTGDGFTNYHEISSGWGGYDGKIKFGDVTGDGKADMEIIQPNGDMTLGVSNGNGFTDYHTISGGWSTFAARLQLA